MKPKYIKDAIMWNSHIGEKGSWVRCSDMNFVKDKDGEYYTHPFTGTCKFMAREVYPYEDWMEEYLGTNKNLAKDERFKKEETPTV